MPLNGLDEASTTSTVTVLPVVLSLKVANPFL